MKLILVAGARPNFMKIAPLIRAIAAHNAAGMVPRIRHLLVHTGQHYDKKMSDLFFRDLGIPAPDINLEVGSASHAVQTANVMTRFETVCEAEKPDWLIVVGDVNSTMACSLTAAKLGVKIAHVEAGLRSFDRSMPEEINRLVTDALADLLLTPSADADENLRKEGIPDTKIKFVGNIMIDTLTANLEKARQNGIGARLGLQKGKFVYVTLHRPSNVDDKRTLTRIMADLTTLSKRHPVIFPMHPRTKKMLTTFGLPYECSESFTMIEPIGYHESLWLTENARLVLTDSGGLQEESTYFRTPCLTLRPNTERPITIKQGSNRLTTPEHLPADVETVLEGSARAGKQPQLWDGCTAERIVAILAKQEARGAG